MKSLAVTFVVFDGFDILDVAGPFEVFGEAGYELTVVAPKAGPVRSDTGLTVHAPHSVANLDPSRSGTLLVVGGEGATAGWSTGWPQPPRSPTESRLSAWARSFSPRQGCSTGDA